MMVINIIQEENANPTLWLEQYKRSEELAAQLDAMRELKELQIQRNAELSEQVSEMHRQLATLTAERDRMREAVESGKLWSFMRSVLSQGGAIQQDYQAGKYESYEHYSARLDAAARERTDQLVAALRGEGG